VEGVRVALYTYQSRLFRSDDAIATVGAGWWDRETRSVTHHAMAESAVPSLRSGAQLPTKMKIDALGFLGSYSFQSDGEFTGAQLRLDPTNSAIRYRPHPLVHQMGKSWGTAIQRVAGIAPSFVDKRICPFAITGGIVQSDLSCGGGSNEGGGTRNTGSMTGSGPGSGSIAISGLCPSSPFAELEHGLSRVR